MVKKYRQRQTNVNEVRSASALVSAPLAHHFIKHIRGDIISILESRIYHEDPIGTYLLVDATAGFYAFPKSATASLLINSLHGPNTRNLAMGSPSKWRCPRSEQIPSRHR